MSEEEISALDPGMRARIRKIRTKNKELKEILDKVGNVKISTEKGKGGSLLRVTRDSSGRFVKRELLQKASKKSRPLVGVPLPRNLWLKFSKKCKDVGVTPTVFIRSKLKEFINDHQEPKIKEM